MRDLFDAPIAEPEVVQAAPDGNYALRSYQREAADSAIESLSRKPAALVVMPTGTGKTVVFGHVAKHFLKHGRVLVVAHREELIQQEKGGLRTCSSMTRRFVCRSAPPAVQLKRRVLNNPANMGQFVDRRP